MKSLALALPLLLASSSAFADDAAIGPIKAGPVPGAPAVPSPAGAPDFRTLARETVRTGHCPEPRYERDEHWLASCTTVIEADANDGWRSYVEVWGSGYDVPVGVPVTGYYHGETRLAPIGTSEDGTRSFWTKRTVMIEFGIEDGAVRRASATRETVSTNGGCPQGARDSRYLVARGGVQSVVLTCAVPEPLSEAEVRSALAQLRADWSAALAARR